MQCVCVCLCVRPMPGVPNWAAELERQRRQVIGGTHSRQAQPPESEITRSEPCRQGFRSSLEAAGDCLLTHRALEGLLRYLSHE